MRSSRKKKNSFEPQAKIDLHGYSTETAYHQTKSMLLRYRDRGITLVEVVTGKSGAIRTEFPFWMESLGYRSQVSKHNGSFLVWV